MKNRILAVLAYVLPTIPIGYFWHLTTFADYYKSLDVYRDELIIPLGVCAMLIQGVAWSFVYERMFAGEPVWRGAWRFASLAAPIAWSFMVLAVGAKHRMASVGGYLLIETAFVAVQYAIVSPLIAAVYARKLQR
jgi:predicted membrane protein